MVRALAFAALPLSSAFLAPGAGADPGATAVLSLSDASATVAQTTDTAWTLEKIGSAYPTSVSWTITATRTATVSDLLVIQGQMTVTNAGSGPASIGNIVVNLQTRVNNQWVTASSDVEDATAGDAVTAAHHAARRPADLQLHVRARR